MLASFFSLVINDFKGYNGELPLQFRPLSNWTCVCSIYCSMKHFKFSICWKAMKKAAVDFNDDNAFKLAASLSYSMIFSIAPFLILAISLAGIIWAQKAAEGQIYEQIKDLVGASPAAQIQDIITNIQKSHHTVA